MEESSRRAKDRRFIVELQVRAMNRILLLYVKVEGKSNAFGIKESSGEERGSFCLSPMVGWLSFFDQYLFDDRLYLDVYKAINCVLSSSCGVKFVVQKLLPTVEGL